MLPRALGQRDMLGLSFLLDGEMVSALAVHWSDLLLIESIYREATSLQLWLAYVCFAYGFMVCFTRRSPRREQSQQLARDPAAPSATSLSAAEAEPAQPPSTQSDLFNFPAASSAVLCDEQLNVAKLLLLHRTKVDAMRTIVSMSPHFKPERHDGLWLLRYLLSHRLRVAAAAKAARAALQIRHELRLDEIANFVRTRPPVDWPHFAKVRSLAVFEELALRPHTESAAEHAAFETWEMALLAGTPPAEALAEAQACHRARGGVGEWQWYLHGLIEAGKLGDMQMHELWPIRSCLDELNKYCDEWVFQVPLNAP